MSIFAVVRADSLNFPLFLHVLGAMILVGGLLTAASALAFARGNARLLRLGYWSLLAVALPGYVLMRIGAQWIYAREHLDDAPIEADWIAIGFIVADAGALVLLVSLVVGGVGVYRLRDGKGAALLKITLSLSLVLLAASAVAAWAMAGKPG